MRKGKKGGTARSAPSPRLAPIRERPITRWSDVVLGAGVFAAALFPRTSTWSGTFRGPLVLLEEVDAYYHLRRIELALANNFAIPGVDTYVNHPFGARIDWAPGFDLLFALVYHLLSKMTAAPLTPAAVGAVGVAVLGSVTAVAAALLARRWGLWAAIAAGLAVAWSPAAVAYSRVGRLDHHVIEPFWLVAMCATYAWSRARPSPGRSAALGGVLVLGTFFWPGMAFYAAALALAFPLEDWFAGARTGGVAGARKGGVAGARKGGVAGARTGGVTGARTGGVTARDATVAYVVATALGVLLALASPWADEVAYYALSWFQPLLFAAIATGFAVVAWLEHRGVEKRWAWALGGAVPLTLGAVALALGTGSVGRGLAFLFRSDVVATTLLESRSLVELGPGYALRWLTPVGVLLPALWGAAAVLSVRRRNPDPLLAAALALGVLAVPLTLLQMRFGPHCAVVSGLLAGWLIARAARDVVQAALVAALAVTLAWGVRPATLPDSAVHPYLLGGFDALLWLRQSAPATSHFRRPLERPEYGVAAEWVWGHWITQVAQKPNIANPLGQTPANVQGVRDVARLFLAESEAEALAMIDRLGIRYLLLSSIPVTLPELAAQAGRDPSRYVLTGPDGTQSFRPPFFDTFHSRLYLDGGPGAEAAPPSRVRLVFESRVRIEFMGARPAVRIFEVVPGARLHGTCRSDTVEVRAELGDSEVVYTVRHTPAADGAFAVGMPYASEATEASIPARIRARCGDEEVDVLVSERAVLDGRDVRVQLDAR
jgi:asparagine N-glycosylation enzyme membrane subunit Stt3